VSPAALPHGLPDPGSSVSVAGAWSAALERARSTTAQAESLGGDAVNALLAALPDGAPRPFDALAAVQGILMESLSGLPVAYAKASASYTGFQGPGCLCLVNPTLYGEGLHGGILGGTGRVHNGVGGTDDCSFLPLGSCPTRAATYIPGEYRCNGREVVATTQSGGQVARDTANSPC
jgi:hypothetical protein